MISSITEEIVQPPKKPQISQEMMLVLQALARIAHAVETLAKAADPNFKPAGEGSPTMPIRRQ